MGALLESGMVGATAGGVDSSTAAVALLFTDVSSGTAARSSKSKLICVSGFFCIDSCKDNKAKVSC